MINLQNNPPTLEVIDITGNKKHSTKLAEEFLYTLECILILITSYENLEYKKLGYELSLYVKNHSSFYKLERTYRYNAFNIDDFIVVYDRTTNPSSDVSFYFESGFLDSMINLFNTYKPVCVMHKDPIYSSKAFYVGKVIDLSLASSRLIKKTEAIKHLSEPRILKTYGAVKLDRTKINSIKQK